MSGVEISSEDVTMDKFIPETTEWYSRRKLKQSESRKVCKCSIVELILFVCLVLSTSALGGSQMYLFKMMEELKRNGCCQQEDTKAAAFAHLPEQITTTPTASTSPIPSTVFLTTTTTSPGENNSRCQGIATMNIAYLYGNKSKLDSYILKDFDRNDPLTFSKAGTPEISACQNDEYVNTNGVKGDHYCKTLGLFMISQRERFGSLFNYFEQADWMKLGSPDFNYNIVLGGKIKVKSSGMYLVQGHVNFNAEVSASMRIIKEDKSQVKKIVGGCSTHVDTEDNKDSNVLPCSAFQVLQLLKDELVYMDIHTYTVFEVRPETLHITVIKLNDKIY